MHCIMEIVRVYNRDTYNISNSANPLKACSSTHIISLLSNCKLLSDGAPLNIFRPIVVSELCERSLRHFIKEKKKNRKMFKKLYYFNATKTKERKIKYKILTVVISLLNFLKSFLVWPWGDYCSDAYMNKYKKTTGKKQ